MAEIHVVGLGPGDMAHLSYGAWEALQGQAKIFLRTAKHPVVQEIQARGIVFETFDCLYEKEESFPQVYAKIVRSLICAVRDSSEKQIIYAVPGHPLVAEDSVHLLLQEAKAQEISVVMIPSMSFIDTLLARLCINSAQGLLILDALSFTPASLSSENHIIFTQVYNGFVASDLKLVLLDIYPPEHSVMITQSVGIPGQEIIKESLLWEMDHYRGFNHLTSLYIKPYEHRKQTVGGQTPLDPLIEVMEKLLSPQGCPWDLEQTHESLKPCLIEETYEVIEAIDSGDMYKLKEELGDLLLQVVFHALLAQKRGDFSANEVIQEVTEKMIRRHPHVFGTVHVADANEVITNWEQIKAGEKGKINQSPQVMDGINRSLPAMLMAEEVQKKAKKVGFDWSDALGPWEKLQEEIGEFKQAWEEEGQLEEELGDILFTTINLARFFKISPEAALYQSIRKFVARFNYMEGVLAKKGLTWKGQDLEFLDALWLESKKIDKTELFQEKV